ncbi:MAG: hypothetical protein K0Q53_2377 [Massilibacillus sp.]|nr:hypothetical protein [Massilibacillus sp.]
MNMYLLFMIALIPIVWLMVSLVGLKIAGHKTTPLCLYGHMADYDCYYCRCIYL